jgi:hypothetical protein
MFNVVVVLMVLGSALLFFALFRLVDHLDDLCNLTFWSYVMHILKAVDGSIFWKMKDRQEHVSRCVVRRACPLDTISLLPPHVIAVVICLLIRFPTESDRNENEDGIPSCACTDIRTS